jgi:hypothetical protein
MTDTNTPATYTSPTAVLFTADRFLAAHLAEVHPGVTATPATADPRLHGVPDPDGVLRLTGPTGTRTFYVGVDLDDARVWSRAVDAGATHVVVLPDGIPWLRRELTTHLGAPATHSA